MNRLHRGGDRYAEIRADCEQASLRASWGGRALLEVGKKRGGRTGARVQFAAGGIAWEERGLRRTTLARDPRRPELAGTEGTLRKLIAAIESGGETPSPGEQAITTLEVIEAAYASATTGERIALVSRAG
jgi:predicted dehydrogenase